MPHSLGGKVVINNISGRIQSGSIIILVLTNKLLVSNLPRILLVIEWNKTISFVMVLLFKFYLKLIQLIILLNLKMLQQYVHRQHHNKYTVYLQLKPHL